MNLVLNMEIFQTTIILFVIPLCLGAFVAKTTSLEPDEND